ncbi:MAG: hypothetical protein RLZZ69_2543, partial [Cyanobacteriota bacterium]
RCGRGADDASGLRQDTSRGPREKRRGCHPYPISH